MTALLLGVCTLPFGGPLDLLSDLGRWSGGPDRPTTEMEIARENGVLSAAVTADGGDEDYTKLRLSFDPPLDLRDYARLEARARVTCDDPSVGEKTIAFVFYDELTRREDLPDHPMTQQVIGRSVAVGQWLDLSEWLVGISRSQVRGLDLYIYELPPAKAHHYTWEFSKLELVAAEGPVGVFDGQFLDRGRFTGTVGDAAGSVRTEDGLGLALSGAGSIASVSVGGNDVGEASADAPCGLLVRDSATDGPPVAAGGEVEQVGDEIRQSASLDALGLTVDATYRSAGQYLEVAGRVSDTSGRDRAVTVYLALPLSDGPWQWWDSMSRERAPSGDQDELAYLETGMDYGLNGAHSRYPLGAVTLPNAGLTLAVRMDEPVVHRIVYNAGLHRFFIAVDFGLMPETRVDGTALSSAPFRFLVYRHDPEWGFRSALQRYYDFFPGFFEKRAKREGGWYVWGSVADTPRALDEGFAFHWGPSGADAVKYGNQNGLLALLYIEAEFYQQTMGDWTGAPTLQECLARLEKVTAGDADEVAAVSKLGYASSYAPGLWVREHSLGELLTSVSGAASASVFHDAQGAPYGSIGQFPWMGETKWGVIFPCNLDPDIPGGKGPFASDVYLASGIREIEEAGAHYDGIALDSLGGYGQLSRVSYRREHFKYASIPLSFSARDRKPVQLAAFATLEWVRALAEEMHGRGMVLMANCSWGSTPGWLTFCAPYLDIFGAEATQFADPDFIRAIAYRKPCTDLPYSPRPEWEVPWHQLHCIYPGAGNDPGAMTGVAPSLQALAAAGWEPITGARVTPDTVRVERYGSGDHIFYVLHNTTDETVSATLDTTKGGEAPITTQIGPKETVVRESIVVR